MLFESLRYFAHNFLKDKADRGYRFVSGEKYWMYRSWAESFTFGVTVLLSVAYGVFSQERGLASTWGYVLAAVALVLGITRLVQLRRRCHDERAFAELFYS